jgi:hypothetical protein
MVLEFFPSMYLYGYIYLIVRGFYIVSEKFYFNLKDAFEVGLPVTVKG